MEWLKSINILEGLQLIAYTIFMIWMLYKFSMWAERVKKESRKQFEYEEDGVENDMRFEHGRDKKH